MKRVLLVLGVLMLLLLTSCEDKGVMLNDVERQDKVTSINDMRLEKDTCLYYVNEDNRGITLFTMDNKELYYTTDYDSGHKWVVFGMFIIVLIIGIAIGVSLD